MLLVVQITHRVALPLGTKTLAIVLCRGPCMSSRFKEKSSLDCSQSRICFFADDSLQFCVSAMSLIWPCRNSRRCSEAERRISFSSCFAVCNASCLSCTLACSLASVDAFRTACLASFNSGDHDGM